MTEIIYFKQFSIKRWKPKSKRPIGRPQTRWEDGVLEDIKSMNVRNWKKVVQKRESWKKASQNLIQVVAHKALKEEAISTTHRDDHS